MSEISREHRDAVCRIGQGTACCRYLMFDGELGFVCAKGTNLQATLDHRAGTGQMTAVGDNCPGWPNPN